MASPGERASTVTTATGNSARRGGAAGFTLLEMLAVIVLMAIAVSVAAVSLHGRASGQLDAAAQRVAAGLRATRTRAMATGQAQWFSVNLRAHTFAAPGHAPRHLPRAATLDVTSAASASAHGVARIGYFPDGSSSGGNIVLVEKQRRVDVAVDWLTGVVSVTRGASQ